MTMMRRRLALLSTGLLVAVVAASLIVLAAPRPEAAAPVEVAPTSAPTPPRLVADRLENPRPLRLAVVGDSITAWSPPFALNIGQSWVPSATSNQIPLVGGWALPGATTAQMLENVTPADDADLLIIMAGTNDLYQAVPVEERLANIDAIADIVGARHVVLSSTAPYGFDYAAGLAWNVALAEHAADRGWDSIDPWWAVRDGSGAWVPGTDYGDRIHPNPATATLVGVTIRDWILDEF